MPAAVAAAVLLAASPAAAQLSTHAIALESGISTGIGAGDGAHAPVALAAARWLEGDVDALVRVAIGSARETAGRAAYARATAGLRWSVTGYAARPQLHLDAGVRTARGHAPRWTAGAAAGLELFLVRDLALSARVGARLPLGRGAPELEALAGVWAYF